MSWTTVYEQFEEIVNIYFPDEEEIEAKVKELYMEHKGEPDWDEAWRRWNEELEN